MKSGTIKPSRRTVVVTYADSERGAHGGLELLNNRQYIGQITDVRPAPDIQSKAKGFTSDELVQMRTTKGHRQFYNGRIIEVRDATLVEKVKIIFGLFN